MTGPRNNSAVRHADVEGAQSVWASRRLLIAVFAVAAAVRVVIAAQDQIIHVDGAFQYIPAARAYYEGGLAAGLDCIQMPLYPMLTALLAHLTGGNLETAARLISLAAGIAAIVPLFLLGRMLFGYRVAVASAAFFAVSPLMVRNSSEVTKESLFSALFLLGLWLGWLAVKTLKWHWCVAAGLVGALAYLCRPDGIDLFFLWAIWLGAGVAKYALRDRRRMLRYIAAGLFIAAAGLALARPYVVHIHKVSGQWSLSMKKPTGELIKDTIAQNRAPDDATFLDRLGLRVGRAWASFGEIARELFNEVTAGLFPLLLMGLVARRSRLLRGRDRYLLIVCGVQLAVCYLIVRNMSQFAGMRLVSSNFSGRHLLSLILAAWCWLGCGFAFMEALLRRGFKRLGRAGAVASPRTGLVLLALLMLAALPFCLKVPHRGKLPRKYAGLWLREHGVPNPKLITHARRIAYYAGVPREGNVLQPGPWLSLDANLRSARRHGVHYLAFDEKEIGPAVRILLDRAVANGELQFLHKTDIEKGNDILIYAVLLQKQ